MIQIKPEKIRKKKITPYYLLVYNYMIGDANGNTSEEVRLSKDNPHIERFCKLMNKLKPTKGYWGIMLERKRIEEAHKQKQLTLNNYDFLCRTLFPEDFEGQEDPFMDEFEEGVKSTSEYSFLVFKGVDLYYVDENGKKHQTTFKK